MTDNCDDCGLSWPDPPPIDIEQVQRLLNARTDISPEERAAVQRCIDEYLPPVELD